MRWMVVRRNWCKRLDVDTESGAETIRGSHTVSFAVGFDTARMPLSSSRHTPTDPAAFMGLTADLAAPLPSMSELATQYGTPTPHDSIGKETCCSGPFCIHPKKAALRCVRMIAKIEGLGMIKQSIQMLTEHLDEKAKI